MYMNLTLEMRKRKLNKSHLAVCLQMTRQTISRKIACHSYFNDGEQSKLQKELFPDCDIDYLFQVWNPDSSGLYHVPTL